MIVRLMVLGGRSGDFEFVDPYAEEEQWPWVWGDLKPLL